MKSTHDAGYFACGLPFNRLGQGPEPLLAIPGLMFENKPMTGIFERMSLSNLKFLGESYTVFVAGRRPAMTLGSHMGDIAAQYVTLIREEFGRPVDVVGTSTGGSIALQLAADHSDWVRRLVVHSSAYSLRPPAKALQLEVAERARRGDWVGAWKPLVASVLPPQLAGLISGPVARLLAFSAPDDPSDLITTIEAEDAFNMRDRLGEIAAPTLVIGGEEDPFYSPELFRETAASIPNARLVLYPGMGHPASGPKFRQEVLTFLAGG
jgi:pimeloyl-ACP methyl ester carboxylesterase